METSTAGVNLSFLIMHDVPENTEIGIDMKFWRVGKTFRGIKGIPNGFHYIYYSAVNADCQSGQRRGFCEWFSQPTVVVKRWVAAEEDFIDVPLSSEELKRLMELYGEISPFLGPYPSECHRDWVALTNLINPSSLQRLLPECGRISSCTQYLSRPSSSQQRLLVKTNPPSTCSSTNPEDLLPELEIIPGTEIRFSNVPKKPLSPPNCDPLEVTSHGIDQSYTLDFVLETLISTSFGASEASLSSPTDWGMALSSAEKELLAELQLSYVVFLLNHVLDGWYQWRRIVQLLANCERSIQIRPHLFVGLISVLYHQLCSASQSKEFLESDKAELSTAELADLFFSETSDCDYSRGSEPAFLPSVLRVLLRNILCALSSRPSTDPHRVMHQLLQERAEGFCRSLEQRFHWGIRPDILRNQSKTADLLVNDIDWDSDEAPVIVQM